MQARGAGAAKRPRPIRNCIAASRLLGRCSGRIPAWPYPPPRCFECSRAGKPDRSRANKTGHLDKLPTVSRGIRSQTAPESDTPAIGSNFPRVGETEGMPDCGRASDAGPCAHVYRDSTQAPGRLGDWVPEGEECHCDCTPVRKGEKLLRRTLLGPRL